MTPWAESDSPNLNSCSTTWVAARRLNIAPLNSLVESYYGLEALPDSQELGSGNKENRQQPN